MDETTTRPLTDEERARLGPHVDPFVTPLTGLVASLLCGTFLFVLGLGVLSFLPGDPSKGVPVLGALTLLGTVAWYVGTQTWRRRAVQADPARADLKDGTATVSQYDATAAIEIEELEDEGRTYYLRLGDGRVLLLSGQYLDAPVDAGTFPSTRFQTVRSRSGLLLSLTSTGERLLPLAGRKPHKGEFGSSGFAADGVLLTVPFDALR